MTNIKQDSTHLRKIPSVDEIVDYFQKSMSNAPYALYLQIIRRTLQDIRSEILKGTLFFGYG